MKVIRSKFLKLLHAVALTCFLELATGSSCGDSGLNMSNGKCQGRVNCPSCVRVSWFERKPYVYREQNQTKGILPDILQLMLSTCCGNHTPSCWHVYHHDPIDHPSRLLFESSSSHIIYPVIVDSQDPLAIPDNMIGLIPPSSIAFVVPKGKRDSFPKKLLMSVFEAWPVLILTLLLSILAGTILWLAEIRVNSDEFPRNFIRGSWEGFWWAFVSMTTVGYGDRAPRSFFGRVFAVMWILLGICIVSIFTATLTTSLTTISLDIKKSLTGAKIGVLERSIELSIAMQQQSDITVYLSIEEIRTALDDDEIEGALLDKYLISYFANIFPDDQFKVDKVLTQERMKYGAVVNDTTLDKCFRKVLYQDRFLLYNFIEKNLQRTLKSEGDEAAVRNSQSIFDPTGDLFYPSLYSCIILVVIIFIIGLLAQFLYLGPRTCLRKKNSYDVDKGGIPVKEIKTNDVSSYKKLEDEMMEEMQAIFKKYQAKMALIKSNQTNEEC